MSEMLLFLRRCLFEKKEDLAVYLLHFGKVVVIKDI